jgi:hypothetical protein
MTGFFCSGTIFVTWKKPQLVIKLKLVNIVKCTMSRKELSNSCKNGNHIDCEECVCKCHIPGTMEYMSRNIARLEKERPGLGESLPAFT